MQGTLILVTPNSVHNLGSRELPESGHFNVTVSVTETECDCPPANQGPKQ